MELVETVGIIGGICLIVVLSLWTVVLFVFCSRAMVKDIAEDWEILGEKRKLEKEISELKRKNSKLEQILKSAALEYLYSEMPNICEKMKSNDAK